MFESVFSIFYFCFSMSLIGLLIKVDFANLKTTFFPGSVSKLLSVYMQSRLVFDRPKCLFKCNDFQYYSSQ